jgi:hypothetical protein
MSSKRRDAVEAAIHEKAEALRPAATLRRVIVEDNGGPGISILGPGASTEWGGGIALEGTGGPVLIEGAYLNNNAGAGVVVSGANVRIRDSIIRGSTVGVDATNSVLDVDDVSIE